MGSGGHPNGMFIFGCVWGEIGETGDSGTGAWDIWVESADTYLERKLRIVSS